MTDTKSSTDKTLTRHHDIRNWVADRQGIPAIARVRNRFGEEHAQLKLRFARADRAAAAAGQNQTQDQDQLSPCSWTAWLAELDRQQLALRIGPDTDGFELVERSQAN